MQVSHGQYGIGTLLAKVDIEHAYQNVHVHPDDRQLVVMMWDERLYIDTVLLFGLRSAPIYFHYWRMHWSEFCSRKECRGCSTTLNDFLTWNKADSDQCSNNLSQIQSTCEWLGMH